MGKTTPRCFTSKKMGKKIEFHVRIRYNKHVWVLHWH